MVLYYPEVGHETGRLHVQAEQVLLPTISDLRRRDENPSRMEHPLGGKGHVLKNQLLHKSLPFLFKCFSPEIAPASQIIL